MKMDSTNIFLRSSKRPNTTQGCRIPARYPGTMQSSWASPRTLSPRHLKHVKYSAAVRPHTVAGGELRPSSKDLRRSESKDPRGGSMNTVATHSHDAQECWIPPRSRGPTQPAREQLRSMFFHPEIDALNRDSELQSGTSSLHSSRCHTAPNASKRGSIMQRGEIMDTAVRDVYNANSNGMKTRELSFQVPSNNHATETKSKRDIGSLPKGENGGFPSPELAYLSKDSVSSLPQRFQPVKSYSSPSFNLVPLGSKICNELPQAGRSNAKAAINVQDGNASNVPFKDKESETSHSPLDASTSSSRNSSINNDFKVANTGPMASLVTEMPTPLTAQRDSSAASEPLSVSPSMAGRMLRKEIEASSRMYPRNTWGPITKWGYQEHIIPGDDSKKHHFINSKEKLEKQRLEARSFGHQRHRMNFKSATQCWEEDEAQQSLTFIDASEQFSRNVEKMLHAQNDSRIARTKRIEEDSRARNGAREWKRLERREEEYIAEIEREKRRREDSKRIKANDSAVVYNIVTLEYPNNYAGDLLRFDDAKARWRQSMRALRIQSKQSGARMYNVLSWTANRPCSVPPPKPEAPMPPDPSLVPSPRKPALPSPKNMLHSLEPKSYDIPVACTPDFQTNW